MQEVEVLLHVQSVGWNRIELLGDFDFIFSSSLSPVPFFHSDDDGDLVLTV